MTTRIHTPTLLQNEAADSGAAALGIVLRYYGSYVPIEELRYTCGTARHGISTNDLLQAAQVYGLNVEIFEHLSLAELQTLPLPQILTWGDEQCVVLEGFGQGVVYINDPATGTRTVSLETFNDSFSGTSLTFQPTGSFRRFGEPFRMTRAVRRQLEGSRTALIFLALVSLFLVIPGFLVPALLAVFVDDILVRGQHWMAPLLLGLAATGLLRALLTWLQRSILLRLEVAVATRSSAEFFSHILRVPIVLFLQRDAGDMTDHIERSATAAQFVSGELTLVIVDGLAMIVYALLMLRYSILLTLIGVVFALFSLVILRDVSRRRENANRAMVREQSKLVSALMNGLHAVETFKAAGAENDLFARWSGLQARLIGFEQRLGTTSQIVMALSVFLFAMNAAILLVVGGELVLQGALTVGMLVAFQSLMLGFSEPIGRLVGLGSRLQETEGAFEQVNEALRLPVEAAVSSADESGVLTGAVQLQNVSFGYTPLEAPIIQDFSLSIQPGERVALVGTPSSGKSTITRLIAGLYQPWSGSVLLDGQEREAVSSAVIKRSVALVGEHGSLFSGTVQDNLTLWNAETPLTDLWRATRDACIHDLIMQLPGGYNFPLVENGANFSAGEQQRLEIARALVGSPTLLILDEATCALDAPTETKLIENLGWRGCTCLIITNRLSALRDWDTILVMDAGRIVEQGSHAELSVRGGLYAQMLEAEARAVDAAQAGGVYEAVYNAPDRLVPAWLKPQDSYHAAARIIVQALGSQAPVDDQTMLTSRAPISGLRTRPVTLRGAWWRDSRAPLLGYTAAGHEPVALLHKAGGYQLHDPAQGTTVPVDAAVAAALDERAYQAYRPFSATIGGILQLLRFGLGSVRHDVIALLIVGLISGILGLVVPLMTATVIDHALPLGDTRLLQIVGLTLAFSALGLALFHLLRGIISLRIQGRLAAEIQPAIWDRLLNLPPSFFQRFNSGDLAARALAFNKMNRLLSDTVTLSLLTGFFSLVSLLLLLYLDTPMALVALVLVICAVLATLFFGGFQQPFQRRRTELEGEASGLVFQLLRRLPTLRVTGVEDRAFAVWARLFGRQQRLIYRARRAQNALRVFTAAYPAVASLVLFALMYTRRTLTLGEFVAFNLAFVQLNTATVHWSSAFVALLAAVPQFRRLQPILEAAPETDADKQMPDRLSGSIAVRNLSFRYAEDRPWVLRDVSFMIEPGEFVAIVGATGVGKSTLMRLLIGFEQPRAGEIYYDVMPLSQLNIQALRRQIGAVLQDAPLFAGDILTNMTGAYELTDEEVWRAARLAALEDDIRQMPRGLHTDIGEDGEALSGSQRQRLRIARALASRPHVLLFDETTGALDEPTQAQIMTALRQISGTRILLTQRLSAAAAADRILVLHEGKIVESGTYQDLLNDADGWFATHAREQTR